MCEKEWCGKWRQTKTVMEEGNGAGDDNEEKRRIASTIERATGGKWMKSDIDRGGSHPMIEISG